MNGKYKFNWKRKKEVFYVVRITCFEPIKLEVVKRFGWECDADRYKREVLNDTGEALFVISTNDWIDEKGV